MARRDYPRSARLNELLRELLASELEHIDDDRLVHLSITAVETDSELHQAKVFVDVLDDADAALAALEEHRGRLKRAVGKARIRRVPELSFSLDPGVAAGARVEEILRKLHDEEGTP